MFRDRKRIALETTSCERNGVSVMSRLGTGLTRRHWLDVGQDILREEGIEGVSVKALTQRLGVTKGSFYHHFEDIDAFLRELANYFSGEHLAEIMETARERADGDPKAELIESARIIEAADGYRLMSAMRSWAKHDEFAAASVRRLDEISFRNHERIFKDIGFSRQDAKVRAYMAIALAVTDVGTSIVGLSRASLEKKLLEVLVS